MSDNNYSEDSKNFFFNEQNKKKKKKLEDEYGMMHMGTCEETSPELMNNFLCYVENFEAAWKNAETKKIKEIIGFPDFKKLDELDSEQLESEVDKILDIYEKHNYNISIIEPDDVSNSDFYKFLTEELPGHETNFINIPGMNTNFIYEEFHPNDKLDAKNSIEHFLYDLKNKNENGIKTWLSKQDLLLNGKSFTHTEFITKLLKMIPENIIENKITFKKLDMEKNKVYVDFIIDYESPVRKEIKQDTLNLQFGIEKCEFGMFNIKEIILKYGNNNSL